MGVFEKLRGGEVEEFSIDKANMEMLGKADKDDIETVFHRVENQDPRCSFCEQGISCRNCLMGPCRITKKADSGVCGATADTMVARGLLRNVIGGASSHVDHARHAALILQEAAKGEAPYEIRDERKLRTLAQALGIEADGLKQMASEVAERALSDLGSQHNGNLHWTRMHATQERLDTWRNLGVMPEGADRTITEGMHRTHMGVDADPVNITLGTVKTGIVDGYFGLHMATDMQDVLFGTPSPKMSQASLGVLEEGYVNLAVHGHVPILSEKIVEAAEDLQEEARKAGAEGINVVGICCTGNELLERQGVPMAGNELNSELAVVSGALDAMVVDVQCIYPSMPKVADSYHTKVITTSPIAKIPGAEHIEFEESRADEVSREIVTRAIENFSNRDPDKVRIPEFKSEAMVGFSAEAVIDVLSKINSEDPLQPLVDSISNGSIRGVEVTSLFLKSEQAYAPSAGRRFTRKMSMKRSRR